MVGKNIWMVKYVLQKLNAKTRKLSEKYYSIARTRMVQLDVSLSLVSTQILGKCYVEVSCAEGSIHRFLVLEWVRIVFSISNFGFLLATFQNRSFWRRLFSLYVILIPQWGRELRMKKNLGRSYSSRIIVLVASFDAFLDVF